tara:strand:+ start:4180 stop:6537 length:2358 start_codon:yes stop_codon:yes gene_type:complete
MALTQISSDGVENNSITNAHLHSGAAIAGSKISPDFGSQNITTSGDLTVTGTGTSATFTSTNNNYIVQLQGNNATNKVFIGTTSDNHFLLANGSGVTERIRVTSDGNLDVKTGNILVSGTVDGRDLATDGTKLDGIESGATADQTAAEIRTLVGNASDSNVFTDALLSKLNGIATNATNVTNYVTNDASDTLTGATYTFSSSTSQKIILRGATDPYIRFQEGTTNKAYIQWNSAGYLELVNEETSECLRIASGSNGLQFKHDGTYRNVYHTGNLSTGDGGLTQKNFTTTLKNKLDGIAANANNYSFPFTISQSASNGTVVRRHDSGYIFANFFNTTPNDVTSGVTKVCVETGNDGYIRHGSASAIRSFINVASGATNNGSGNVSDRVAKSGDTMTGELQINARLDVGNGTGNDHEIRIYKKDNNVSDHIQFYNGTTRMGEIGCEDTTWLRINQETNKNIYTPRLIRADAGFQVDGVYIANEVGSLRVSAHKDIGFAEGNWTGNNTKIQLHSNTLYIVGGSNGILLRESGTNRWHMNGSGHLIPQANITYDIGSASNFVRYLYSNRVYVGSSSRYLSDYSGQYGSIQINGGGGNGYEGFSIDGRVVFMHNGSSDAGLFNDVNNEWMIYTQLNGTTIMYFNGAQRIRTESYGARMNGTFRPNTTNSSDLGASDARWATFYVVNQPNVSDRNEKNTIQDSDLGLDFINKLRGVSFKWNDTKLGTKTRYGLIVQEVEEAIKELGKNPDDIGLIDKPEKGAMGLCVSELIAPLVKSIQELSAKVALLEGS